MAVLGDDHEVLDPDPELARDVDARLDRDHVARLEHVLGASCRVAAPRGPRARPRGRDRGRSARRGRRRGSRRARPRPPPRRRLPAGSPRARPPVRHGRARRPRAPRRRVSPTAKVRVQSEAVAVDERAHVPDDQVAGLDLAVAGLGVRKRAVRAGGDDRRERRLGAELAHPRIAPPAATSRSVRPARPSLEHRLVDLVGEPGGLGDRRQLALVLAAAQPLDEAARRRPARPLPDAPPRASRGWRRWSRRRRSRPCPPAGRASSGIRRLAAIAPLECVGDLARGALDVAEVGDERPGLRADHGQRAGAGEAGQPADVRRSASGPESPGRDQVADDQLVESLLGDPSSARRSARSALTPRAPRLSISSASRYPSAPLPETAPSTSPSNTERRRHSSRAVDVGEVDLDRRHAGDLERVADRPAVVGPGAGVEQRRRRRRSGSRCRCSTNSPSLLVWKKPPRGRAPGRSA